MMRICWGIAWLIIVYGLILVFWLFEIPQLFWFTTSNSVRPGIYRRTTPLFPVALHDFVEVYPPERAWAFAQTMGIRTDIPWIKTVEALPGDTVCVEQGRLTINAVAVVPVHEQTPHGHTVPLWKSGCYVIPPGHFLPLSTYHHLSYDGRYYGPVSLDRIVAKVKPLVYFPRWMYEQK